MSTMASSASKVKAAGSTCNNLLPLTSVVDTKSPATVKGSSTYQTFPSHFTRPLTWTYPSLQLFSIQPIAQRWHITLSDEWTVPLLKYTSSSTLIYVISSPISDNLISTQPFELKKTCTQVQSCCVLVFPTLWQGNKRGEAKGMCLIVFPPCIDV